MNIYYSLAIGLDTRKKEMNPDCPFFSCAIELTVELLVA